MTAICDTGPLVAYLNRHDPHHAWALAVMKQVRPPMLILRARPHGSRVLSPRRRPGYRPSIPVARTRRPPPATRHFRALATHSHSDGTLQANGFGRRIDCGHERVAHTFASVHNRSQRLQRLQTQRPADDRFRSAAQTLNAAGWIDVTRFTSVKTASGSSS